MLRKSHWSSEQPNPKACFSTSEPLHFWSSQWFGVTAPRTDRCWDTSGCRGLLRQPEDLLSSEKCGSILWAISGLGAVVRPAPIVSCPRPGSTDLQNRGLIGAERRGAGCRARMLGFFIGHSTSTIYTAINQQSDLSTGPSVRHGNLLLLHMQASLRRNLFKMSVI